jgi:hypothetical protein
MPTIMQARTGRRAHSRVRRDGMPDVDRAGRPALFDRSAAMAGRGRECGMSTGMELDAAAAGDIGGRVGGIGPGGGGGAGRSGRDPAPRKVARTAPVPQAARDLLTDASLGLGRACATGDPADRYAIAHLAALRAAAAVLAARARPTRGRRGSAWTLMSRVAPEFDEWAAFFAAGSAKRQAVQAGLPAGVTAREADDLVRQVAVFLSLVGDSIGDSIGTAPARDR